MYVSRVKPLPIAMCLVKKKLMVRDLGFISYQKIKKANNFSQNKERKRKINDS